MWIQAIVPAHSLTDLVLFMWAKTEMHPFRSVSGKDKGHSPLSNISRRLMIVSKAARRTVLPSSRASSTSSGRTTALVWSSLRENEAVRDHGLVHANRCLQMVKPLLVF